MLLTISNTQKDYHEQLRFTEIISNWLLMYLRRNNNIKAQSLGAPGGQFKLQCMHTMYAYNFAYFAYK